MRALVTGGAGFIGSHLCERLVGRGDEVVAIDSFDPFYPRATKEANLAGLAGNPRFRLVEADIRDPQGVEARLGPEPFDVLVHLAARAGVRPSIEDPLLYSQVNLDGTVAMLEVARRRGIRRFVFGSSSSVYGNNEKVPFAEEDPVDRPISPYAATKRGGELLCHTYHHLYGMTVACLRFFTVYGPRQRPDLAIHTFARLIAAGEPIPVFGDGSSARDYTFVDDIVRGVEGAIAWTERPDAAYEVVNLGGGRAAPLLRLVQVVGDALGAEPRLRHLPPQPGDVERTFADIAKAQRLFGYRPATRLEEGIPRFVEWFRAAE